MSELSVMNRKQVMLHDLLITLRKSRGDIRDIKIGIFYDTWHAEFDEEVPPEVRKTIVDTVETTRT
jgi:hypothetical protein